MALQVQDRFTRPDHRRQGATGRSRQSPDLRTWRKKLLELNSIRPNPQKSPPKLDSGPFDAAGTAGPPVPLGSHGTSVNTGVSLSSGDEGKKRLRSAGAIHIPAKIKPDFPLKKGYTRRHLILGVFSFFQFFKKIERGRGAAAKRGRGAAAKRGRGAAARRGDDQCPS